MAPTTQYGLEVRALNLKSSGRGLKFHSRLEIKWSRAQVPF